MNCTECARFLLVVLVAVGVVSAASPVCAQENVNGDLKGFWQKGDASNWTAPVRENSSTGVVYRDYPLAVDKIKADTQAAVAPAEPQNNANAPQNAQQKDSGQPMSREQIIAKHGAPDLPRPIRAAKDSPPEMQGLFEAINSGDKELAWQYSLALARRNTEIQKTVSKATDYQVLAMEALGMRAAPDAASGADALNPNRAELEAFMNRTKAEQAKAQGAIDPTQAGIAEAAGVDAWADSPVPAGASGARGAVAAQGQAARQLPSASSIPVDPGGKVKVLFFFDERDGAVKGFAESLRPLKQRFKDDSNVSMVGLTKRSYDIPTLKNLGATTNFPFALLNGEALAQELRIHTYPVVVFVATTSKQTYRVEGTPIAEQIEQVITLMKGSR